MTIIITVEVEHNAKASWQELYNPWTIYARGTKGQSCGFTYRRRKRTLRAKNSTARPHIVPRHERSVTIYSVKSNPLFQLHHGSIQTAYFWLRRKSRGCFWEMRNILVKRRARLEGKQKKDIIKGAPACYYRRQSVVYDASTACWVTHARGQMSVYWFVGTHFISAQRKRNIPAVELHNS